MSKEQRARELLASKGRFPSGGPIRFDVVVNILAAALPDEQPAQEEKVTDQQEADAVVTLFKRYQEHGEFLIQVAGIGIAVGPDSLLAPPAGPAVEELVAALRPFAEMRLSTEAEVSDLVLRSPAEEMRRSAAIIEQKDAQICVARKLTTGATHAR